MNHNLAQRIAALGICPHGPAPGQPEIPDDVLEAVLNVLEGLRSGHSATELDYAIVRRYRYPEFAARVAFEDIMNPVNLADEHEGSE